MYVKEGQLYKKNLKKLNKHFFELNRLNLIIKHIETTSNFNALLTNPISIIYGVERLKYQLNKYYSFNLCKRRTGTIRLIFSYNEVSEILTLEYISLDHYHDFKE